MAAPTLQEIKDYLRQQTTANDTVLTALLLSATAMIEGWLGRPIALSDREVTIDTLSRSRTDAIYAQAVYLPTYPISEITSIEDSDGVALDLNTLRVSLQSGAVRLIDGGRFLNPPYTIVYKAGLAARSDFNAIEPALNQAIIDTVADLFQRRNPAASSEREGGGVGVDYNLKANMATAGNYREDMLLQRVRDILAPWRVVAV